MQLPELMAALARVPARRARFVEEKTLAALAAPLRSVGTLDYRRPDHLAKLTTAPQPERLEVDGDRLTLAVSAEPPRVVDLGSQPEIRALVDTIRGTLAGDAALLGHLYRMRVEGSLALWRLTLEPAEARLARFVRVVQVDGEEAELRRVRIEQANGDVDLLTVDPLP